MSLFIHPETMTCKYCRLSKPLDCFAIIKRRWKESTRRDHRCSECMDKINRRALHERDRGLCGICGLYVPLAHASIDHVIPMSKGGTHIWGNVQLAHRRCNHLKGNKAPWEVASFARAPARPNSNDYKTKIQSAGACLLAAHPSPDGESGGTHAALGSAETRP